LSGTARARTLVALLFFVSGLASLILETVWVRAMVLVFGSTTFAVSTVLTAFMAGLAIGSLASGRRASRLDDGRRALLAYGLLELVVAGCALALPQLARGLPALHAALFGGAASSYWSFALLRFLLSLALLVIPTAAMGATLPVLARYYEASRAPGPASAAATSREVGGLYALNTAGATAGVLLAGFLLLPRLGMAATNLIACGADTLLGLVAIALYRRERRRDPPPAGRDAALGPPGRGSARAGLAIASIGVSGALAMIYQVAWNRALSLVIGSSTYAFSLILACVLCGLAGGAALYARRQSRGPDQAGNLSVIHLLTAATALAGTTFLDRIPVALLTVLQRIELSPGALFLTQFLLASSVILLPSLFMGMVLPAVIGLCAREPIGARASRLVGNIYAVNTAGAILGSFAGGFLMVPLLGLERTLRVTVIAGLVLAAAFALLARARARAPLLVAIGVCAFAAVALTRPWNLELLTSGVFRVSRYAHVAVRPAPAPRPDGDALVAWRQAAQRLVPVSAALDTGEEPSLGYRIVHHREGITTTVTGARTVDQSLSASACWVRHALLVNGKVDASLSVLAQRPPAGCSELLTTPRLPRGLAISDSGDAETQVLGGLLPFLLRDDPRPAENALVIGWGSGMSVGAALQAPLRRLVAVELEREVLTVARAFSPENHSPERDPRLVLLAEDGRNFLQATRERFDVIVSEPSNPWMAGCGNLFTREFFASVREHLRPGGVFLQWLQAYEIAPENVWSILGTLADSFPGGVHVFSPARASSDLLLVARRERGPIELTVIARSLRVPSLRRELARVGIREPEDLLARLQARPAGVHRITAGAPRNTDDNARIEFAAPIDLVNFRRYSSRAITTALRATLGEPPFASLDPGSRGGLCRALLQAGRPREALTLEDPACRAAAAALRSEPPRPGRQDLERLLGRGHPRLAELAAALAGDGATAALARLLRPGEPAERRAGLELLGRIRGAEGDRFDAVLFLTAARSLDPGAAVAVGSNPIDRLLARELYLAEQRAAALALVWPR
jgi:spermidine synthase